MLGKQSANSDSYGRFASEGGDFSLFCFISSVFSSIVTSSVLIKFPTIS